MNTNPTYQQELLRKYIDGSITEAERHALDKLALDDPFLFDALEGIYVNKKQSSREIEEIQKNIGSSQNNKSTKSRRIVPWQWMSIAAGIFIVMVIGFLIQPKQDMQWNKTTAESASRLPSIDKYAAYDEAGQEAISESQMAENRMDITDQDTADSIESYATEHKDSISSIARFDSSMKKNEPVSFREEQIAMNDIKSLPNREIDDITSSPTDINNTDDIPISVRGSRTEATNVYIDGIRVSQSSIPNTTKKTEDSESLEPMATNASMAKKSKSKTNEKTRKTSIENDDVLAEDITSKNTKITGYVKDESGLALIGANVLDPKTNAATLTDIDGKFELNYSSNSELLEISYTGYATKLIPLDGSPTYDIIMEEGALLDEVVVSQNFGSKVLKSSLQKTRPMQGFDLFTAYVKESIILPEGCEGGTVTLSFTITTDGNLENIKVENANYPACSTEAIRLLKNGGKWVTTPPRQTVETEYIMKMNY